MCYYFDDIIKIEEFHLHNILKDEKSYENILVDNILYKSVIDSKRLRIRFNIIGGFIRVYYGTRCLVLFESKKRGSIYTRIKYVISV